MVQLAREAGKGSVRDAEKRVQPRIPLTADQLAPNEPLSPELVLVLSPQLRAEALARLGSPVWATPRSRMAVASTPIDGPFVQSLGEIVVGRVVQLGLIFVLVAALTLVMSVVAHAVR
jgi:hypothetical protein